MKILRWKLVFTIVFLALLSGCASPPTGVSYQNAQKLKNLAVVSLVAHQFNRHYTGVTAFGNEREKLDISDWKIDDEYEAQIVEAMASLDGIKARRIPGIRDELVGINDPNGPWDAPGFANPKWSAVEAKLRDIAAKHAVDGFVIVTPRSTGDFLAGTNQHFRGVGFYVRGAGERTMISMLHVMAWVSIADSNGKPVASTILVQVHEAMAGRSERTAPLAYAEPALSRMPVSQYDEQRKAVIRKLLLAAPERSWIPTLTELLTPKARRY